MGDRGPLPNAEVRRRNKKPAPAGTVAVARPTKPQNITGEAAKEWNRIVPELLGANYLAKLDRAVLIRYCRAWARWVKVEAALDADLVTGVSGSDVRNPLWLVLAGLEKTLSDLGGKLGLDPASRRRRHIEHVAADAKGDEDETDELEAYRKRLKEARDAQ